MARAISLRLDDEAERALARLEAAGMTRSEAIRKHWWIRLRPSIVANGSPKRLQLSKQMRLIEKRCSRLRDWAKLHKQELRDIGAGPRRTRRFCPSSR